MAYGVGTPADDWIRYLSHATDTPVDSKITHASLGSNILTNHGVNCRRFRTTSGASHAKYFRYTNAAYNSAKAHSIRGLMRGGTGADNIVPYLVLNSDVMPGGLLSTSPDTYRFYAITLDIKAGRNWVCLTNSKILATRWENSPVDCNVHSTTDAGITANDWYFYRFDSMRQGDDMRLQVYLVKGRAACDTLDGNGEPAWGTPLIDCYHQLGNSVPVIVNGLGTFSANWGTTTPHYGDGGDYSGAAGFVVAQYGVSPGQDTHVDSLRIKQMP